MIRINSISYKYRKQQEYVFSDVSLNLEGGHIYGLLGLNGVGKTTLLYNVLGLLKPTTGNVTFEGTDTYSRMTSVLQECFAVTDTIDFPSFSIKKYLKLYAPFYPNFNEEQFWQYMTTFNMMHKDGANLNSLSMGERKKVYISFALACNTRLVVMDEPTNGLDIPAKAEFRKNISLAMSDNRCIVISTHQVGDIENILDDVVVMNQRGIVLNESISRIGNALLFGENNAEAIYSQPSLGGFFTVSPNSKGEESAVRLELLFNALHSEHKEAVLSQISLSKNY